ncbi:MAG: aspartate-semialdehyde dehydrogenase [Candidatus Cloacimonadaceae bacterium]
MRIAIVGATGEVGRMMITCLEEAGISATLDFFASERSEGTILYYNDEAIKVKKLETDSLKEPYDYILMSAGGAISKCFAPLAAEAGNIIIDNSSAWRREAEIPLVVPEINAHELKGYRGIIANPNCSTIQLVLALAPLHAKYGLAKVVVATYQSVSGSGHKGVQTLEKQRQGMQDNGIYPEPIDLNVIPQIGAFQDSGYSQEEEKMQFETVRILHLPELKVCATTVRVPVLYGHSEAVYAEFNQEIELTEAAQVLSSAPSVRYHENTFVTPLSINKSDDSHVCRLRYGTDTRSLAFWNVGNNVRLGAATNAVRIMLKHIELNS